MTVANLTAKERKLKPWFERRFLGLDTESTGVNTKTDRIVSTALCILNPTGIVERSWYTLVKQDAAIPPDATAIHGITTERANAEGKSLVLALHQLCESLAWAATHRVPVVIYNAPFDWDLVHREAARCMPPIAIPPALILDPLAIDRHMDKYRKGSRKLADVAKQYGIDPAAIDGDLHDARKDAVLAARVMRRIAMEYFALQASSLEDLQRGQAEWFAAWLTGFQQHRQTMFQDSSVEDRKWPR